VGLVDGHQEVDAVVVGSGPNGLAAAVTLARAGLAVTVLEAQPTVGGGARTVGLPLADGVVHDLCSAVHPLARVSPFFRAFDLEARGVRFAPPEVSYGQPLAPGPRSRAALAYGDLERTVDGLGPDGAAFRRLLAPWLAPGDGLCGTVLADRTARDLGRALRPSRAAGFVRTVLAQGTRAGARAFVDDAAPALLAGTAAHAMVRQPSLVAAATGLLLAALAHGTGGWPVAVGGSQSIVRALVDDLQAHGGTVRTGVRVGSVRDLPPARAYLFDTTPRTLLEVLGDRLPRLARRELARFAYGPGVAKVDLVVDGPVPWAAPGLDRAGTVHLGGTRADVARAEAATAAGRHAENPVVLVSDPAVADPARQVGGLRPLWAYVHVPAGSSLDPVPAVLAQVERFAPGFGDTVVASRGVPASALARHDESYVGGDIGSGALSVRQVLGRPSLLLPPYATGLDHVYLCSASTPPGPGVHGLCGWYAARRALRRSFGVEASPSLAAS